MIETVQVLLPADVMQALHHAIAASEYSSSNDAVADAVREWIERRVATIEMSNKELEELRRLCDEADTDDAMYVDPEAVFARLEARYHVEDRSH